MCWCFFCYNFKKDYCNIRNQLHRIFRNENFLVRKGNRYIWDQKCFAWAFLGWNFKKNYCYFSKQHPRIFWTTKFYAKMIKFLTSGTKNALFGYFYAGIIKRYCHIWNQYPRICQKWVSNNIVNFGIKSAFSWSRGFTFLKVRVRDPFMKYAILGLCIQTSIHLFYFTLVFSLISEKLQYAAKNVIESDLIESNNWKLNTILKFHVKLCFVYISWEGTRERPRGSCRQVDK